MKPNSQASPKNVHTNTHKTIAEAASFAHTPSPLTVLQTPPTRHVVLMSLIAVPLTRTAGPTRATRHLGIKDVNMQPSLRTYLLFIKLCVTLSRSVSTPAPEIIRLSLLIKKNHVAAMSYFQLRAEEVIQSGHAKEQHIPCRCGVRID